MKNKTVQQATQTPTISVGSVTDNGAIVREILRTGVVIGIHGSTAVTKISFRECESLFGK